MPQLDSTIFSSQSFWLFFTLLTLYVYILVYVLPKLAAINIFRFWFLNNYNYRINNSLFSQYEKYSYLLRKWGIDKTSYFTYMSILDSYTCKKNICNKNLNRSKYSKRIKKVNDLYYFTLIFFGLRKSLIKHV